MRIRLYLDEDSARHSLARELRFRGADVVTAIETGMILSRQGLSVGEQMRRLLRLINQLASEEMRNRVEFLSAWGPP